MPACERCWSEYRDRQISGNYDLTYSEVVAERERTVGVCSPEEQCGELHLLLRWKDGGHRCRCGAKEKPVIDELAKEKP